MSAEITIAQFIAAYATANNENDSSVQSKVYKWVETGHLPTHKVPDDSGILVTRADPATFQPPRRGQRPKQAKHGVRVATAAKQLGLSRQTIYDRLKKENITDGVVPHTLLEKWEREKK